MAVGARITDEVDGFRRVGDLCGAVRALRRRRPERLRWRAAAASMTAAAVHCQGLTRARIEEPIREMILDMDDRILRRETVLDARRVGLDLDRGEVLPVHSRWELKRSAFLVGVDHELLGRYMQLPGEFTQLIDTAGAVLLARSFATALSSRAERLETRVTYTGAANGLPHEQALLKRAAFEREQAQRWAALSKVLVQGSR